MEQINSEYFSDKPHSFGGKYKLYELYNKDDVDKALSYNDVYTKFKQHRKSKSYSAVRITIQGDDEGREEVEDSLSKTENYVD